MKIGILTFQWAINYGAILQMYALKTYVQNLGMDVEILNFNPSELTSLYSLDIFEKDINFKTRIKRIVENIVKRDQYRKFDKFIENNFNLTSSITGSDDLKNKVDDYDLIIVGSDQVWNYNITKNRLNDYLLYKYNCRKISYAASLGNDYIPDSVMDKIQDALKEFQFISIREKETANYLNQIMRQSNIHSVLDPVFLLSQEEWGNINNSQNRYGNYILIYMLEYNRDLINTAKMVSDFYCLPIYSIEIPYIRNIDDAKKIKKLHDIGPEDFVGMFKNANYVITNSFHGTAFSLLFNIPLLSFCHSNGNVRQKNLLKLYELDGFQINNSTNIEKVNYIFSKCQEAYKSKNLNFNSYIKESKDYLNRAINYHDKKLY